jgi:hypothetical protein
MSAPLDKFGEFIVQNLRDKMLHNLEMMMSGSWKAPDLQKLQTKLSGMTDAQKQTVRELAEELTTTGMHDLLFAISDSGGAVKVLVDGEDVAKLSDGLQVRFSATMDGLHDLASIHPKSRLRGRSGRERRFRRCLARKMTMWPNHQRIEMTGAQRSVIPILWWLGGIIDEVSGFNHFTAARGGFLL